MKTEDIIESLVDLFPTGVWPEKLADIRAEKQAEAQRLYKKLMKAMRLECDLRKIEPMEAFCHFIGERNDGKKILVVQYFDPPEGAVMPSGWRTIPTAEIEKQSKLH